MINEFKGSYRFLSNFWLVRIELDGINYPSVEHAYQASKTSNQRLRENISRAPRAGDAKWMGRDLPLPLNWDLDKDGIMLSLLRKKFEGPLGAWLVHTGDERLVEGNTWGDQYWGVCNGKGLNRLGELLMQVREEIRNA